MIRQIFFDLGKVLLDYDLAVIGRGLEKYSPLSGGKILEKLLATPTERAWERGEITNEDFYHFACHQAQLNLSEDRFAAIWSDIFWLIPSTDDLLSRLRGKLPMGLITNISPLHNTFIRKKFDVFRKFDFVIASCEVGHRKPDPRIYKIALKQTNFGAEETLFIDDRAENIEGAKALGFQTLHFQDIERGTQTLKTLLEFPLRARNS